MPSYSERLHAVIPGGAHTYSRGDDQFPVTAPEILERGEGAYVWDPSGRRFLDYGMALRAVTLGYANERVNKAAISAINQGNNLTRASLVELHAAERIVELIGAADMVKFAKNGSNATSAAVKIARAYTGRRFVCVPRQHPFFSFDDWFIGTTVIKRGVPLEHHATTLLFDYGDQKSLNALFVEYPGQIAAVILEPATTIVPCPPACRARILTHEARCSECPEREAGFLHGVSRMCRSNGALFILDEMITGFRWDLRGAQAYFGVEPDLSTFGKAMANGFAVAAVVGKREFMSVGAIRPEGMERTFLLSSTHGGEMAGLAAFLETTKIYEEADVVGHLWRYGARLRRGLTEIAVRHGVAKNFYLDGPAISLNYVTRDADGNASPALRTLFAQEMARHGVLMPWIAVSLAHNDTELDITLGAADKSIAVLAKAMDAGVDRFLEGPSVRPVFRPIN